jgi:hypothetical protein
VTWVDVAVGSFDDPAIAPAAAAGDETTAENGVAQSHMATLAEGEAPDRFPDPGFARDFAALPTPLGFLNGGESAVGRLDWSSASFDQVDPRRRIFAVSERVPPLNRPIKASEWDDFVLTRDNLRLGLFESTLDLIAEDLATLIQENKK